MLLWLSRPVCAALAFQASVCCSGFPGQCVCVRFATVRGSVFPFVTSTWNASTWRGSPLLLNVLFLWRCLSFSRQGIHLDLILLFMHMVRTCKRVVVKGPGKILVTPVSFCSEHVVFCVEGRLT